MHNYLAGARQANNDTTMIRVYIKTHIFRRFATNSECCLLFALLSSLMTAFLKVSLKF